MADNGIAQNCTKRSNGLEGYRKLDSHPKKRQIIQDLITQKPYRDIAAKYKISVPALRQWAKEQLAKSLIEDQKIGLTAREQLEWLNGELQKILKACKRELGSPDDPNDYDFSPSIQECSVQYIRMHDDKGRIVKESLDELVDRLENHEIRPLRIYSTKTDTRRILLEAMKLAQNNIETIAKITGELSEISINQQINQVNIDLSGVILPKIMEAIRDATDGNPEIGVRISDAIYEIVEAESEPEGERSST